MRLGPTHIRAQKIARHGQMVSTSAVVVLRR
jgi:hypothetical protein